MPLTSMNEGAAADGQEKPELMGSYVTGHASNRFTGKSELDSSGQIYHGKDQAQWLAPQEVEAQSVHRPTLEPQEMPSTRYD